MKHAPIALCLLAAAALSAAPQAASQAPAPRRGPGLADTLVLARVNGEPITLAWVRASFGARHDGHAGLLVGEEIIRKVVDKAVEERLLIQEGRRMGIAREPRLARDLEAYKDMLLLERLEETALRRAAEPSAAEVRAAYDLLPRRLRVAVIETRDEARRDEARLRLRAEGFEAAARRLSVHPSRNRGGELGWITWGILDPETEAAALATPAGSVSEPFEVPGGWRMVKVIEERRESPPPLEQVSDRLAGILLARRRQALETGLLDSIRKAHPPREDAAAVRKLLGSADPDRGRPPDPPDEAVLVTGAGGIELTAGHVRHRAKRSGLSLDAAWKKALADTLLIDEARRRVPFDASMKSRAAAYADAKVREELERSVILKPLTLTDAEVRAFFQSDPAAFSGPASYRMRHIVLGTRAEAEAVLRRLQAGEDFAALAREVSVDRRTAESGGDMGWVEGPAPAGSGTGAGEGVFALAPGGTSEVVKTALGHSIVQMLEVRKPQAPAFEAVRHAAAERLMIQKQHELRKSFVDRLRKVATISVDRQAVDRAVRIQGELTGRRLDPGAAAEARR